MRALILVAASALLLSACGSAPSEEAPTGPSVVCVDAAINEACPEFDDVVSNADLADGNVVTQGEAIPVTSSTK